MKKFIEPELVIIEFSDQDIITYSEVDEGEDIDAP